MDHMLRPKVSVLPESATIPDANLIRPAPDRFSHRVTATQAYYYAMPSDGATPDGSFDAGTSVLMVSRGRGNWCHVADARGLYVVTSCEGLKVLT
jgi:hypothetical protein